MFIMLYQDSSNGHTNFKWRVNTIIQYLVIDKFNSDLSLVLSIYHSKCKHGSFSYVYITKKKCESNSLFDYLLSNFGWSFEIL